jgi:hypothetical protein
MSESGQLCHYVYFVGKASSISFEARMHVSIHYDNSRRAQVVPRVHLRVDMGVVSFLDTYIENFLQTIKVSTLLPMSNL